MSGTVSSRYFQVLDSSQAIYDGQMDLSAAQTAAVYNGNVAVVNASGDVALADGTNPFGLFYDHMALEEYPTSENLTTYLTGDKCNVVTGAFRALCGTSLFSAGTLPAVQALLRDNEDGTIAATGSSTIIGRCLGTESVGGDMTVAVCYFRLPSMAA